MSKISIKQAIDSFLLSCRVEGRSQGTIDCYADKLKGFLWYTRNYDWPEEIIQYNPLLQIKVPKKVEGGFHYQLPPSYGFCLFLLNFSGFDIYLL